MTIYFSIAHNITFLKLMKCIWGTKTQEAFGEIRKYQGYFKNFLSFKSLSITYLLPQVLGLIEAVTSKAGEIVQSHVPPENSSVEASQEGKRKSEDDIVVLNIENAGNSSGGSTKDLETRPKDSHPHGDHSDTSTSKSEQKVDPLTIFLNLPTDELCKLCLLLAREGYVKFVYVYAIVLMRRFSRFPDLKVNFLAQAF